MQLTAFALTALLARHAAAQGQMLRFACSQLTVDRIDPLVNPGETYTPHLHQIVGGNSFRPEMEPVTYDLAKESTCTSCSFKQDKSNYWTAVMFAKHKNGTYHRIPQTGNGGPQGKLVNNGGLDVYYMQNGQGKMTAFKPGFRMLVGTAGNTDDSKVTLSNICHRCWKSPNEDKFEGGAPCTGSDTVAIPNDPACKMIRQTIIFPACWNGKDLDSPDHKAHVAYGGNGVLNGGNCPSTHPVRLPQIMYELMWNVTDYSDRNNWPTDGSRPFVYSMNLGGSAAHADYVFGWEGDTLQRAMDNHCDLNRDCPAAGLTAQQPAQYNACTKPQAAPEPVDGWLAAMPSGSAARLAKY